MVFAPPQPKGRRGRRAISLSFVVDDATCIDSLSFRDLGSPSPSHTLPYLWRGVLSVRDSWRIIVLALTLSFWGFHSSCSRIEDPAESRDQNLDGWQVLFDGESLRGWDSTRFGGEGLVHVKNGAIFLFSGDSLTGITWQGDFPEQDYEISLEAQRVQGSDFFCGMTFPVGDSFCSVIVGGWAGSVVGVSSLDGLDASENETTRLMKFENGRWYRVRVRVGLSTLEAWIDNTKLIDLSLEGRKLSVRPEVRLSRPFGIASWQTTAALRDIRIRYPLPDAP